MKLATWHYHIEVSSICPVKCPKCPRQELPDTLVQSQLSLEFFKKNFTEEVLSSVTNISFCGDDGDPIYCKEFLLIIKYLKDINTELQLLIVTNGSYQKIAWWEELSGILNKHDEVHFSLDGWDQESNEKYRIGSNWDSIITGITLLRQNTEVQLVWASIAFAFNHNHLDKMQDLASVLGFDEFQITKSTKWEQDDLFRPPEEWVSNTARFERVNKTLTNKITIHTNEAEEHFNKSKVYNDIRPLCHIGTKGLYINSQGDFFPCCWLGNRYNHNNTWDNKFNLYKQSLTTILNDEFWENEFLEFNYQECKQKCNTSEVTLQTVQKW